MLKGVPFRKAFRVGVPLVINGSVGSQAGSSSMLTCEVLLCVPHVAGPPQSSPVGMSLRSPGEARPGPWQSLPPRT